MNILQLLKKGGSGIHIKEKNKGSFTRWCGGNVTEECIRKGKASSNPKIRKKATFASNVRKWKHQQGGTIINTSPLVTQHLQWLQNMPDYLAQQEELKKQKQLLDLKEVQQKQDLFGSILGTAKDYLLDYLSYKSNKTTTNQVSNTTNQVTPNINNQFSLMNQNPQYWTSNYGSNFKFNLNK